ncbi:MAG TPA: tRNA uridine-5-carboxymethylaminomethyl(34) synthesis GTPase MnmE [bacterium]|nr:tRNA uridine-5-carboxymethylaminomethyl(34) synthesis GTPase MnmE [bacterium]
MNSQQDTIVAIATPPGTGGVAVIRLSGPRAVPVVGACLDIGVGRLKNRHAVHGWIREDGEPVDEVVVTRFQGPHSYTGEDVVEIGCHGGPYVSRRIVELLIRHGARPARPGEFTERAFLNGRMDLSQAEAVADLIRARTEASRRAAVYQLEGKLSERIRQVRDALIRLCGLLEIELDFGEEDVEFASREELCGEISASITLCDGLLESYERGRACREGVRVAITGSPNVGKSSLLNVLIEKDRAIVTEHPGTTRDIIEEVLDIAGVLFIISDGAGLRESDDPAEREGVRRAESRIRSADIVLLVLDGSRTLLPEEARRIRSVLTMNPNILPVLNKADLPRRITEKDATDYFEGRDILSVSAKTGQGIPELVRRLGESALSGALPREGEVLLTRARHFHAVRTARERLAEAGRAAAAGISQEFVALDLRGALDALGEITGETTAEEILNGIFSGFCVGK